MRRQSVQSPHGSSGRRLRLWIGAAVGLCLAFLWGGIALHLDTVHTDSIDKARSTAVNFARAFEEHILRTVKGADEALLYFRSGYAADPAHFDFNKAFREADAIRDVAAGMMVVGAEGRVVWQSAPGLYVGRYFGDRAFFARQKNAPSDALEISPPITGRISHKTFIQLSRRITMPDGRFGGVVDVCLDPGYLASFYNSIDVGPHGAVAIVGTDGIVRARSGGSPFELGQDIRNSITMRTAAKSPDGVFRAISTFDHTSKTIAYRTLPGLPLVVGVGISDIDALAAYRREERAAVAAGIFVSVVLIGLALLLLAQVSRLHKTDLLLQASEARLRRQLAEIRSIHNAVPFGMALVDPDLRLLSANRWLGGLAGVTDAPRAGQTLRDFAPQLADWLEPICRRIFDDGKPVPRFDLDIESTEGPVPRNWRAAFYPVDEDGGGIVAVGIVVRDITEQKTREAALRESESRYRLLADHSTDVIVRATLEGTRRYISPSVKQVLGYEPEELVGKSSFTLIHPEDQAAFAATVKSLVPNGPGGTLVYRVRRKSGDYIWAEVAMRLVTAPDGSPEVVGAIRDIGERRRSEEALRLAKEEAEAANRAKSAFLANMSHELRTPLNAIIGFSQIIRDGLFGPVDARYRDYAGDIHSSGQHLLDLINDVLDLSKVEVGRLEMHEEEVNLPSMVEACCRLVAAKAQAGQIAFAVTLPSSLPNVVADHLRLKQVVLNLLSNAVKFTPPGGRVTISGGVSAAGGVDLAIADTGIGMSAEEIPIALAPFEQIESSLSRRFEGTGLGLPLAKALTELHGGTLEIASEKGAGTTVTIRLPARRVLVPPRDMAVERSTA